MPQQYLEVSVHPASQGHQAQPERKDVLAHRDQRDRKDRQVEKATGRVHPAPRVILDQPARRASLAQPARKAPLARMVSRARVNQDLKDHQAKLDPKVTQARKDPKDHPDPRVNVDPLARAVARRDRLASEAPLDPPESQEGQATMLSIVPARRGHRTKPCRS